MENAEHSASWQNVSDKWQLLYYYAYMFSARWG